MINTYSRREFLRFSASSVAIFALSGLSCLVSKERKSNILLILADDLGFSDLGCYGGDAQTPHIDSLAENGLRYTQFYNSAKCCPTRASLLTGLHPHQADIGHMMFNDDIVGYRADLNPNTVTIAEALRNGGYATYMSG